MKEERKPSFRTYIGLHKVANVEDVDPPMATTALDDRPLNCVGKRTKDSKPGDGGHGSSTDQDGRS